MKTIKPNPAQSDAMAKALEPFLSTVINPLLGELGVLQQKRVCVCKLNFRFDLIFSLPAQGETRFTDAEVIKATQTGKYPEGMLLWQLFDQPVHGMDWREQAQQGNAIKLSGGVFAMPPAGGAVRPRFIDEIVRDEWNQESEQCRRAGGWKIRIHGSNTTAENPTRQRQ